MEKKGSSLVCAFLKKDSHYAWHELTRTKKKKLPLSWMILKLRNGELPFSECEIFSLPITPLLRGLYCNLLLEGRPKPDRMSRN